MRAVRKSPALRAFWRIHRMILRATRGRLGRHMGPGQQLLLVTIGRKSGESRPVGLTYVEDGGGHLGEGRFIVVATNAGEDQHPAWWLNLSANPNAEVLVGGETVAVAARELDEPERTHLYQRFIDDVHPSYGEYQNRTGRRIPVVALEPKRVVSGGF